MIRSLYSGVSGLQAHGTAIDVVADNIANVNTPGYKAARAQFQALVAQTLRAGSSPATSGGQNPMQVGLGVTVGAIERQMTQGSPQSTGRASDLAIEGNGFFVLSEAGVQRYTRNGSFDIDGSRRLVETGTGATVLGWTSDPAGDIDATQPPSELIVPAAGETLARATTETALGGNLDATAIVGATATTSVRLYDSQGAEQNLNFSFKKTAADKWDWTATDAGGTVVAGSTLAVGAAPQLTFDGAGLPTLATQTISVPLSNGATTPMVFDLNFDMRQLAEETEVVATYQDGLAPGAFQGYSVTDSGILIGSYANGLNRQLGQIAQANFTNPAGLQRGASGAFVATANSGPARIGTSGSGGRGKILAGSLEMSNVDLTREFSQLIVFQRGFQANGRSVTTSDQLLQEILSLKQ